MRCEIAASLLHRPKILFLDEPTIGLDALSKAAVRNFIHTLNARQNTTVILTTHDMQDVEALSQRVLLIGKGRLLLDGSLADLRNHYGHYKKIRVSAEQPLQRPQSQGATLVSRAGNAATLQLDLDRCSLSQFLKELSETNVLQDCSVEDVGIEEIVARLYRQYELV